jgi:hypothetical protein
MYPAEMGYWNTIACRAKRGFATFDFRRGFTHPGRAHRVQGKIRVDVTVMSS